MLALSSVRVFAADEAAAVPTTNTLATTGFFLWAAPDGLWLWKVTPANAVTLMTNATFHGAGLASRNHVTNAINQLAQPLDADLTDLADGSLTGSKVGTGINADNVTSGTVGTARLGSGTANSSTFLRGDNTWATPAGSGDVTAANAFGTDKRLITSDGTGKGVKATLVTVDGADITGLNSITDMGGGITQDQGTANNVFGSTETTTLAATDITADSLQITGAFDGEGGLISLMSSNSNGKFFTFQAGCVFTNLTLLAPTNGWNGLTPPFLLVVSNVWGDANGTTGQLQWISQSSLVTSGLASSDIDTSAELRGILGDESGTGAAIFAGGNIGAGTATTASLNDNDTSIATTEFVHRQAGTNVYEFALSDETTDITTGTAKVTWRPPYAITVTAVRSSLSTASSSGLPTVDINEAGTTILSTKLTIDANEKTSTTAATAAVISDASIADDAEITFDIDTAGTGAKGLKVKIYYTRQ